MPDKDRFPPYLFLSMACFILICVFLLKTVETLTRDRISENRLQASMHIFSDIIPDEYNKEIFNDSIQVTAPDYLGTLRPVNIYRLITNDGRQAVIIYPIVARGYRSEIELGVLISEQGVIGGVRVVQEEETPGIGDKISQDKTDWILMFTDRSLSDPHRDNWRVSTDGGAFDQISGATITSRSVINAVKNVLEFHENNRESLYSE